MPIYNVKKKMNKAAERLGFGPGEHVVAACMTFPRGHKRRMAIQMGAGAAGASMARTGTAATAGHASRMPNGQHFLAVTDRRLIATTVRAVSTNPKEIVAEWSIDEVHNVFVDRQLMASTVKVQFVDGSVLELDGAHSSGAPELHNILA